MNRITLVLIAVLVTTNPAAANPIAIGYALFAGPLGSIFSFSALVTAASGIKLLTWDHR